MRRRAAVVLATTVTALVPAPSLAGAAPPSISAPAAIVVAPAFGDVLFRRDAGAELPIASTTKLMTALLVLERDSFDQVFTAVHYHPQPAESVLGLDAGEQLRVDDLLRALFLASANDAAVTLAVGTSGSVADFVAAMNARATSLGLSHTHYANPVGLDAPGNYSSAADLVRLAARVRLVPFVRRTVALAHATLTSGSEQRVVDNSNDLVGPGRLVNGIKTGHTQQAGYVLVGSATRGGVTVISAVLGEQSKAARDADTLVLLRYGLDQYRRVPVLDPNIVLASSRIRYREGDRIDLVPARPVTRILRRGERARTSFHAPRRLTGPLPAGTAVGSIVVRVRGRVVDRVALVTAQPVPKVSILERAAGQLRKPGTLALLAAIGAGIGALALALRRRHSRQRQVA